ncbi:unnamed protein product, partial [Mesorhabditis belari]|uniref:Ammonium transporter AmtB-like domain-containing protein n=1 Tax=Mesorhabditis belari TaxID=2138241 RepID=A0AAF3FQJ5_9BILA
MTSILQRRQFALVSLFFQLFFIFLFYLFARFDTDAERDLMMNESDGSNGSNVKRVFVNTDFPLFQDIHVMVHVGFGFLMAFLKRYGFSAVSVNLLLTSFVTQYAMLLRGFLTQSFHDSGTFRVSINEMVAADISCVAVLITMGVLLGRLTPVQFLLLAFCETTVSVMVEHVLFNILHVNDGGRSLVMHVFGAYFGLAAAVVGNKRNVMEMDAEGSIYHSDLFSMIGTMFLWIFFPTMNAAIQEPADARHRAIVNTYLAMASCTISTFLISSLTDHLGRFNMIHIQSSTLAGGVAIGSAANAIVYPYHAVVVGMIAGIISVFGHAVLSKRLEKRFNIYDTCGVHNLHGLPGLLSGIISILVALLYAYKDNYEKNGIYHIYPYFAGGELQGDRDAYSQALYQLAGMIVALVAAILGGLLTGLVLRIRLWNQVDDPALSLEPNYYAKQEFSFASKYMETPQENAEMDLMNHRNSRNNFEEIY